MNRSLTRWLVFGCCLAALVAALGWITHRTLLLEKQQRAAASEARTRELVRLALWRMEAEAGSIVVRESARPARHYQAFPPVDEMLAASGNAGEVGEVRRPSPLLGTTPELVRLHFQCAPAALPSTLCSPQVPEGEDRTLALDNYAVAPEVAEAEARMTELKRLLLENPDWERIAGFRRTQVSGKMGTAQIRRDDGTLVTVARQDTWAEPDQAWRSDMLVKKPIEQSLIAEKTPPKKNGAPAAETFLGDMTTVWLGEELVLLRQVIDGSGPQLQGVWLDWPELRSRLLATATDLLPEARLEPIRTGEPRDDWRALVTLPVRLEPGAVASVAGSSASGLRSALAIAWLCLAGASIAIGFVLHRALQLSERRAAFVSAVTHELRTPLTTFRLYSEMLAENAVPEEDRRRSYLRTLCEESDRLMRLVENVLAFSRIERGKALPKTEALALDSLLDRCLPRLRERAEQAGLKFVLEDREVPGEAVIETAPTVVEQVLFNLVDNAAKYAAQPSERRELHLSVTQPPGQWCFTLRDFGPGLGRAEARRLFRPFTKSARDAAESAPGVGLGLALSRRLARQLGGDLVFQKPDEGDGAAFSLVLPRTPR